MTSVISAGYVRRCRRRARADEPRSDSQLDEHFYANTHFVVVERQRPQGNGFAAAVVSSSKAPEVCGGSVFGHRRGGRAASTALSIMQLLQHSDVCVLQEAAERCPELVPRS